MRNVWRMKMEQFTSFTEDERRTLDELVAKKQRTLDAREDILSEGDRPEHLSIMLTGLACRYKILSNGSRRSWPSWCRAISATLRPSC
jgi:CRP-like cAMP-binding protein